VPSGLLAEIKQERPFPSQATEAAVALLLTADRLRRALTAVAAGRGITLQQYNVLRILRGAGAAGLPTLEISERMVEHAPGITRLVDRLEAKSLVRRGRSLSDRRQVLCFITPDGLLLLRHLEGPMMAAAERLMERLKRRDFSQLAALLDLVRRGAAQALPPQSLVKPKNRAQPRPEGES